MSQKYDILPMAFKYDITPQQFLFRQSSSSNSNTPFTKPPSYIPMVTTPEEQPAAGALHRVPSAADLSTDSDADSLTSTQARLICPSSRHIAQRDYRSTIHPTTVLRIIAAILFIASLSIFAISPSHAIPALVFIPLTLLRILSVFIFHTPRGARWRGWRGINLGVDLALVVAVCGSVGCVLAERNNYLYASLRMLSRVGIILGWVAVGFFAVAAADTGRPTKFAFTTTLSLDFWTEDGALSLDNWESERPEMGRSVSLLV